MNVDSIKPEAFGRIFHSGDFKRLYRSASKEFQQQISAEQFIELAASFNEGVNSYQLAYQIPLESFINYIWLDDRKEKAIAVSFNEQQQIQSMYLKPYITYPESDSRFTNNTYNMPVKGKWVVFWGGTNELINYHYAYESQRYAYDLIKLKDGSSFKNNPFRNENYYAFNEAITAPAEGKVIEVVDGIKDNIPGEMDAEKPAGNYVILEHPGKEYSLLAHLKKNSIKVKIGDSVKADQTIGKCGNSGNSSEPHLHFQVMDSSDFTSGKSIRIRFEDGYEPIQGDIISNIKRKDSFEEKIDKADIFLTIGEILLYIPRAIKHLF